MSLSELFNISRTVRRDKAREQDLVPESSSTNSVAARLCNICFANRAKYNCPRCNIPYCSLECFRRREHQDCSAAFSSSAVRLASTSTPIEANDKDRRNVVNIINRLEKNEKDVRQMQEDAEGDESDDDKDLEDGWRLDLTEEQIENASPEELLAMLPPRQRQRFLEALKSPRTASKLMEKLDRKADCRVKQSSPAANSSALTTLQPATETGPGHQPTKRVWQASPWFDRPDAYPGFSDRESQGISALAASLAKILSTRSALPVGKAEPASVDLTHNLCAVLMAYTYTLRHLDIESLLMASNRPAQQSPLGVTSLPALGLPEFPVTYPSDDEPSAFPASIIQPHPSAADAASLPAAQVLEPDPSTLAGDIFDKLNALIPFLFTQPPPPTAKSSANFASASANDPSKLVLTSLDDACMWLISRLSLDSDLAQGGADALHLQLVQDLDTLFTAEPLVPTFNEDEEPQSKYRVASKLAFLPPQQAFAAAQYPLVLNAVADLYLYLDHVANLVAKSSSPLLPKHVTSISIKFAQRKLCFYLANAILADHAISGQTSNTLRREVQQSIQALQSRIQAMVETDKLAAAVNLLGTSSFDTR